MSEKPNRRSFLKKLGVGGVSATVLPAAFLDEAHCTPITPKQSPLISPVKERPYNGVYKGENLRRVAFPLGGLGAGMFCLEGSGAFSHMSVRHKPEVFNEPGMFAAIAVTGTAPLARVLEGPVPDWKKFGQPDSGNGSGGAVFGLPRFHYCEFLTLFPFGQIVLDDEAFPLKAHMTGWSPFIPTDADNSSLPVAAVEYTLMNPGKEIVNAVFSFNSRNFIRKDDTKNSIRPIANGFVLSQDATEEKPFLKGDFAVFTNTEAVVDHCWFRGGWFDPLTIAWETIRNGKVKKNDPVPDGAPGASLYVPLVMLPGEEKKVRLMMAWYVPLSDLRIGDDVPSDEKGDPATGACITTADLGFSKDDKPDSSTHYKPWYSHKFKDVFEVADYWIKNYLDLRSKSELFKDAFYATTLPAEVIEAVAANMTILKSPTVMRQYDGRLWSFEGCGDNAGCCHGSCTHVWNYAQAIPHLFPALERTLRHTEFCENQNAEGHQNFRASLPIRPLKHDFHAAADGQLGGIMKVYREWRISGDHEWLKKLFPLVKVSMDYCIRTWDPKGKGIVEEPHHNTYDIEFWGPDGMCTSFYLGALQALTRMGEYLKKDVSIYKQLYAKGKKYTEDELFNGEYFYQKIQTTGLNAANPVDASKKSYGGEYSKEARELLEKEGPKYQYGTGCLSDGVLGGWIARMCGLEEPLDKEKTKNHLLAVYRYNLERNLSEHANPQRPSFAFGDEGGLLLCSWPRGGKLSLPFVYSDEVWTGIEYQVASHLMLMGQVKEGLEIVHTCRDRYDGRVRNPFNEYECGHWYARALSSYGLLQGLTGVRYDAVDKSLYIESTMGDFTTFLSTNSGFGTVSLAKDKPSIKVAYGTIPVEKVFVSGKPAVLNKS